MVEAIGNYIVISAEDQFIDIVVGRLQRRFSNEPETLHIAKITVRKDVKTKPGQHTHQWSISCSPELKKPLERFFDGKTIECLRERYNNIPELSTLEDLSKVSCLASAFISEHSEVPKFSDDQEFPTSTSPTLEPPELERLSVQARREFIELIALVDLEIPDYQDRLYSNPTSL